MSKKDIIIISILFVVFITSTSFAGTPMRCSGGIVSRGADESELLIKCGQPLIRKARPNYSWIEYLTFNLGKKKFMKRVTLNKGIVTNIETLKRGI